MDKTRTKLSSSTSVTKSVFLKKIFFERSGSKQVALFHSQNFRSLYNFFQQRYVLIEVIHGIYFKQKGAGDNWILALLSKFISRNSCTVH